MELTSGKEMVLEIPEDIPPNMSLNYKRRTVINDREIYSPPPPAPPSPCTRPKAYMSPKLGSKTNWWEGSGKSWENMACLVPCWKNSSMYWYIFLKTHGRFWSWNVNLSVSSNEQVKIWTLGFLKEASVSIILGRGGGTDRLSGNYFQNNPFIPWRTFFGEVQIGQAVLHPHTAWLCWIQPCWSAVFIDVCVCFF